MEDNFSPEIGLLVTQLRKNRHIHKRPQMNEHNMALRRFGLHVLQ